MNRIESILDLDELTEGCLETVEVFELVDKLISNHELYKADMRIAGLYYRTKSVDVETLYVLSRYAEKSSNLEFRFLFEDLQKESHGYKADTSFIEQIDTMIQKLEDGMYNDDIDVQFPFWSTNLLEFKREPTNKHDPNAIQIYFRGTMAGYVPKEHAEVIVKKYSDYQINDAIGIVRKKTGDARVTFDMFPLKATNWMNEAKPITYAAIDLKENKPAIGTIMVDEQTFCTMIFDGSKWVKMTSDEGLLISPLYKGQIRTSEAGYAETFNGTDWEITPDSWWFNGKEIVKHNGKEWVKVNKEEQEESLKRVQEWKATNEVTTLPTTPVADDSSTKVATTAFVTSLLTGIPTAPTTKWVSSINYRDYTGFMRTLMEYATYAHTL